MGKMRNHSADKTTVTPEKTVPLIFESSVTGRAGFRFAEAPEPDEAVFPSSLRRGEPAPLPEVTELDVVRHFTRLSRLNYSIDTHFYPLGSCTMKYNPRMNEAVASLEGFTNLHPLLPQLENGRHFVQGALRLCYELEQVLCEITGMKAFTLQPLAGAHGELTGVMMMAAYHRSRGNTKTTILVPDSAHGTNPATAAVAGYKIVSIPTNSTGVMDTEALKEKLTPEVAGLMVTCPNTLGLFNPQIDEIAEMIHSVDGLMYYDGANLNALLGRCRPGDLGFDVMHINTHKTFTTPHGGGGPGAGPVGCTEKLEPFLPISRVVRCEDGTYALKYDYPDSIGYIAPFYGNFALLVRTYAYILLLGKEGLLETSAHAVLNANYLQEKLKPYYDLPFDRRCMHECVFSAQRQARRGVHAVDLAKALIEMDAHPPTVYFPLIVKEALMVEPTETESKETLDDFVEKMIRLDELSQRDPSVFFDWPTVTPVSRPDEVKAARELDTNYFSPKNR